MSNQATFTTTPLLGSAPASVSKTRTSTDGNILVTAGASGSLVDRITVNATATTAAAACVMIYCDDGTNVRCMGEVVLAAVTVSNAVPGASGTLVFPGGLPLPTGYKIRVGITTTDVVNAFAWGGHW
jgi:hypothetical protein